MFAKRHQAHYEKLSKASFETEKENADRQKTISEHRDKLTMIWFSLTRIQREELKIKSLEQEADSCRPYLRRRSVEEKPTIAFLSQVAQLKGLPTTIEFAEKLTINMSRSETVKPKKRLQEKKNQCT